MQIGSGGKMCLRGFFYSFVSRSVSVQALPGDASIENRETPYPAERLLSMALISSLCGRRREPTGF